MSHFHAKRLMALLGFLGFGFDAGAAIDFSGVAGGGVPIYHSTLTSLYPGSSPINGGYNVTFASSAPGTGFAYYTTTTHWFDIASITDNPSRNGSLMPQINSTTMGQNITGYFSGITGGSNGAICNTTDINVINADFVSNHVYGSGGGVYNWSGASIQKIQGDFIKNVAFYGGAIDNNKYIGIIKGTFIGNAADNGGAISNGRNFSDSTIENIIGDFIGNHSSGNGGAILNDGNIGSISGNFIGNYIEGDNKDGGAICLLSGGGAIDSIVGDFYNNYVYSIGGHYSSGGAIRASGEIRNIEGDFIGNHTIIENGNGVTYGGAIEVWRTIGNITGNFINNYTQSTGRAVGGAILLGWNLGLSADGVHTEFTGNYCAGGDRPWFYNAIGMEEWGDDAPLDISLANYGSITFNDSIEIGNYLSSGGAPIEYDPFVRGPINIIGDGSGIVFINDAIFGAADVTVTDATLRFGSYNHGNPAFFNNISRGAFFPDFDSFAYGGDFAPIATLTLNDATFDIHNGYIETISLAEYSANGDNVRMIIDMNIQEGKSDKMQIGGAATGQTKVIVHDLGAPVAIDGSKKIIFASAGSGAEDAFEVFAVYGNPYMFETLYEANGTDPTWALYLPEQKAPKASGGGSNPPPPPVRPEVMAYIGLQNAAVEQTRGMGINVRRNTGSNKKIYNVWASPTYMHSKVKSPIDIRSDIYGAEAGFDFRIARGQRIGVFASYRDGDHKLNGQGEIRSPVSSKIDMRTMLGGLYYRLNKNKFMAFASIYGGGIGADVKTADGVRADTKGILFGASAELSRVFKLSKNWGLHPVLGMQYDVIKFGDITDDLGKTATYKMFGYGEAEASLALDYRLFANTHAYLKPGLVYGFANNDGMEVASLKIRDTIDNRVMGRAELGLQTRLADSWTSYVYGRYTGGENYSAYAFGLGAMYRW
jgi:hypothetical protein